MKERTSRPRAEIRVAIREESDVVMARNGARELAQQVNFSVGRAGALATAVSEVARNIVVHARSGEILLALLDERGRRGVLVVARDGHPGIPDVHRAMQDGYSTGRGLGLGLPSAKRLMDEFTLESAPGEGTTVTMKKWAHDSDE